MRIANEKVWDNEAFEADTSYNSPAMWLGHMAGYNLQLIYALGSGTMEGTFKLQASSQYVSEHFDRNNPPTIDDWTDVTDSSIAVTGLDTDTLMWNVSDVFYRWVRVVFTADGGGSDAATVNMHFNAKGV